MAKGSNQGHNQDKNSHLSDLESDSEKQINQISEQNRILQEQILDIERQTLNSQKALNTLLGQRRQIQRSLEKAIKTGNEDLIKDTQRQLNRVSGNIQGRRTLLTNQGLDVKKINSQIRDNNFAKSGVENSLKSYRTTSRRGGTLFSQLEQKFGSTKVARAFHNQFVNDDGTMKKGGKFTSDALQAQDKFIKKLVYSLGQLPIFKKIGQGFSQFGRILFLKSLSDFKKGNIGDGLGTLITASLVAALPTLGTWVGNVLGVATGNLVANAVSNGLSKTLITFLADKLPMLIGKGSIIGAGVLASVIAYNLAKSLKGDLYKEADKRGGRQGRITRAYGKNVMVSGVIASVATLVTALGVAFSAPVVIAIAGATATMAGLVSGLSYMLGKGLPDIVTSVKFIPTMLKRFKDTLFGTSTRENSKTSRINVDNSKIVGAQGNIDAGTAQRFSTGRFNIVRFGNSSGQKGIKLNGSIYSKSELEKMGKSGRGGLETLVAGGGVAVDSNSFTNDARVGRAGSSAILKATQFKMASMGYGNMILTSAMASNSSNHAKGKLGHSGGQKFDISGSGMSGTQAIKYAKDLQSTGYFSHAEAEYDKVTKSWHIDARISDQSYEKLDRIQKGEFVTPYSVPTIPKHKQAPANKGYTEILNDSLSLSNSIYKKANIGIN